MINRPTKEQRERLCIIADLIEKEPQKVTDDISRILEDEKEEKHVGKYRYTLTITPRGKVWMDKHHD